MNLSPKRIASGGYASRIIAAIDAEFATAPAPSTLSSRYSSSRPVSNGRGSPHSTAPSARQYYSTASPGAQGTKLQSFILPRPVIVAQPVAPASNEVSDYDANRAMEAARREREKAAFMTMPPYDCGEVLAGSSLVAPTIVYSRRESEIDGLVATLTGPLGFDMEWRPTYRKGAPENRTATIQICDTRQIVIAQVSAFHKVPKGLKAIIEDENVIKCGVNITGDGQKLFRDYGVKARGLVDLGGMSAQADTSPSATRRVALSILVGRYLGRHLHKGSVRMSNWESILSPAQIKYAANDAYCALALHNHFTGLAEKNKVTLRPELYTSRIDSPPTPMSFAKPSTPYYERPTLASASVSADGMDSASRAAKLPPPKATPASFRAYTLWRESNLPLDSLCGALRSPINPLKRTTVIQYLVEAIRADPSLPYERDVLVAMINMEPWTRDRYKHWVKTITQ